MADIRHYRHDVTGLVSEFPTHLAAVDSHLKEVEPDAKRLAYLPIDNDAVAGVLESRADEADEPSEPEPKPVPAPKPSKGK